ncbi:hypothetical protein EJ04DRAFT_512918 [Polyplosphaeria fusca]|uniref:Uncharacterized protein n=1 Tax=Polyplosphaeria fusca TaxID=682080 RepID=A0A9P4V206_9PLEO|nr:hypothetical protein EJ04DRAFT_512918 [Polyplosphaeria fusca]
MPGTSYPQIDPTTSSKSSKRPVDKRRGKRKPLARFPYEEFSFDMTPTSSSPLFKLPREIRDQIYDETFRDCRFKCREGKLSLHFAYGSPRRPNCNKLPRGLLACKQLLFEGMSQFHRDAVCVRYSAGNENCKPSPSQLLSLYRTSRVLLFSPKMLFPLKFKSGHGRLEDDSSIIVVPDEEASGPIVQDLCDHFRGRKHGIKSLGMRFRLPEGWQFPWVQNVQRWEVDLSSLEQLGWENSFDRVEFVIETPSLDGTGRDGVNAVQGVAIVYRLLQQEVENIAKRLVGARQDEDECLVRDWLDGNNKGKDYPTGDWHIQVRRAPDGTRPSRAIAHEGLSHWKNIAYGQTSGPRFHRLATQESGPVTFYHKASGDRIEVDVPTDGRPIVPAEAGRERKRFCADPKHEAMLIQWGVL